MTPNRGMTRRRLLTIVLAAVYLSLMALVGVVLIFALQPFGQRLWTLGGILTALGCVAWGRPGSGHGIAMAPCDGKVHRQAFGLTRKALVVGLAGWGVLVAWSALSRGGVMPPSKGDPAAVRVMTWNILLGSQDGPPWRWHGWSVRKIGILADLSY
jgi:hypothetical protein